MISELKKINIIGPQELQEKVLNILQSSGTTHVISEICKPTNMEAEEINNIQYTLANVKFALSFLQTHLKTKKNFKDALMPRKKETSYKKIKKQVKKLDTAKITTIVSDIEKNLEQGSVKLKNIKQRLQDLKPWKNLHALPQKTIFTENIACTIPKHAYSEFIKLLEEKTKELHIEILHEDNKLSYLYLTYLNMHKDLLANTIREYDVTKHEFQILPVEEIEELISEKKSITKSLKKWKKYLKEMRKFIEPLQMAEDYLTWHSQKLDVKQHLNHTKYFFIIKAWVKKENVKILKATLKDLSPSILVTTLRVKQGEKIPVVIENNSIFSPFESVTNIYGMPKYNEIDPTPYLAPFFITFFALTLTDAGYGLTLAIISFVCLKLFKKEKDKQRLFKLLGLGGILTIIIGALFGGWFGIDSTSLPDGPVKSFIEFFKVIDPIKNTLGFMALSFALGLIHITFGKIVQIIVALKNNDKGVAFSGLGWTILLFSCMVWILGTVLKQPTITNGSLLFILIALFSLIVTESRNVQNIFIKPLVGVIIIIQGLIGIISNTLSYSRLVALGLATGIIGFIFNILAGIFRDLIPYVGWVIWILMIIIGHIFNLAINTLGGFIHSARLQFVEFFPNFMEGGGEKFKPFKRESKYFRITE